MNGIDPRFAAESFFTGRGSNIGLLEVNDRSDIYRASHRVQRSAHPDLPRQWDAEAKAIAEAVLGGASPAASSYANTAAGSTPAPLPQFNQFSPTGGGNNIQASINVNVNAPGADAETVRQAALEGTQAATDEFELRWRQDDNPRNNDVRSPQFA